MFTSLLTQFHDVAPLPKINIDDAKSFIELLGSGEQYFQTFSDVDDLYQPYLVAQFYLTFEDAKERLMELNELGAGVFVTINETDGTGRKAENIVAVRAVFLDLDGAPLEPVMQAEIQPHCVIETSKDRFHVYWLVKDLPLQQFTSIQLAIAARFTGDKNVKDISRVMRVPGFIHQKHEPFTSRILEIHNELPSYSPEELISGLGLELPRTQSDYREKVPFVLPGVIHHGERNQSLFEFASSLRAMGLGKKQIKKRVKKALKRCEQPPDHFLNESDLDSIMKSVMKYPPGKSNRRESYYPLEFAHQIMERQPVIRINKQFYRYRSGYYQRWLHDEVGQQIIRILDNAGIKVTAHRVAEVTKLLELETFKDSNNLNPRNLLNVQNGLLKLENFSLQPHDPSILFTLRLEVVFDLKAECPLWLETIADILPSADLQALVQQIFGYCLTNDISFHKAFYFYGSGANGKSTVVDVLLALVGPSNYSSLSLSGFKERFKLAELDGKLVNISSEQSRDELLHDGVIKAVISGDVLTVERKNQNPFQFRPWVKIIVTSNNLPNTSDPTLGFFRRWIFLPFNQIFFGSDFDLHRSKRIIETELPGVLNWALIGLKQLREHNEFFEPGEARDLKERFRQITNPLLVFIDEKLSVTFDDSGDSPGDVYRTYRFWCETAGVQSLGKIKFLERIEHELGVKKKRSGDQRVLPGIRIKKEDD